MKNLGLIIIIFSFFGCATPYQSGGFRGGYSDIQLSDDIFKVTFNGNGYTSNGRVQNYLLRRCAEVTLENGFKYFKIKNSKDSQENYDIQLSEGHYSSKTDYFGGSAHTKGTYTPPETDSVTKYGSSAIIKAFKEKPQNEDVFDAEMILRQFKRDR